MASEARRPERVAEALLREISALLYRDLKDPRLRGVTLTAVDLSPDMRQARVYFSHWEGEQAAQAAISGFRSATGFIRKRVGGALGLRYSPSLEFHFDASPERAARIHALLKKSSAS